MHKTQLISSLKMRPFDVTLNTSYQVILSFLCLWEKHLVEIIQIQAVYTLTMSCIVVHLTCAIKAVILR